MNNVILFIGISLAAWGLAQSSSGLTMGMSSEKIMESQQLVLLGTVGSVEAGSEETEYAVTVLEYVKTPRDFNKANMLYVVGCGEDPVRGDCIRFEKGQDVLFILNERSGILRVSELSFVSPNPNCTINDLFRYNDQKYDGLSLYQGTKNNHDFYTNHPITAQYYYFNKNLEADSVDVTITVIDDFPDILKEETLHLELEECQPNAKAEMEFVIDSPGSFAISARVEGNGGGQSFSGVDVIDYVAPPLQQIQSGISPNEVECKANLVLIHKRDGSPACVKPQTAQLLVERGWGNIARQIEQTSETKMSLSTHCKTPSSRKGSSVAILYMPTNSVGKLCLRYSHSNDSPIPVETGIFEANNVTQYTENVSIRPSTIIIPPGKSTVVHTIKTGNQSGFYGVDSFCIGMPLAVGHGSRTTADDFPWLGQSFYCGNLIYTFDITGVDGIGVKYVPHP